MSYKWVEMTPRQRDALAAEKVMGWTLTGEVAFDEHPLGYAPNFRISMPVGVPHYTTQIGAAWEVVEKLRRDWKEAFLYETYGWDIFYVTPERICLAALHAVGVEVE